MGLIHVRSPLTVVIVQLHLAGSIETGCPGGGDERDDNGGSLNVNKGLVLIFVVAWVNVVCQFGHIGVPHFVVAFTTWPRVCPAQVQDHEGAGGVEVIEVVRMADATMESHDRAPSGTRCFVCGITRVHLPRLSTRG